MKEVLKYKLHEVKSPVGEGNSRYIANLVKIIKSRVMGLGMLHACIFVSKPPEGERLSRKLRCVCFLERGGG
jgi:hypothetical protein